MTIREQAISIKEQFLKAFPTETNIGNSLVNEAKNYISNNDFTYEYISNKINSYKRKHPTVTNIYNLNSILYDTIKDADELIDKDVFYYHPRLQITPSMPIIKVLPNGDFESYYEDFYLEIVESFTIRDLVKYIRDKLDIFSPSCEADNGAVKYLLKKYNLGAPYNCIDLLLYTVDTAKGIIQSKGYDPMNSILQLDNYIQEGTKVYLDAYNNKVMSGLNKVTQKF